MHRKSIAIILLGVVALSSAACRKDAQISTTMAEIHAVTDEIVNKVNASPTVVGVDEAQKYWDSKKADLKSRWDNIKGARGFQVSDDAKKKWSEDYTRDFTAIKMLTVKHMGVTIRDAAFKSKLDKLVKEWEETFPLK